jgi:hypothetical protein
MAQPNNPKLYNMLLAQAKAKYPSRKINGLSFPAAKWFGNEYARQGGGFVDSIKEVDPKLRDVKQENIEKEKRKEALEKKKKKQSGFVV